MSIVYVPFVNPSVNTEAQTCMYDGLEWTLEWHRLSWKIGFNSQLRIMCRINIYLQVSFSESKKNIYGKNIYTFIHGGTV